MPSSEARGGTKNETLLFRTCFYGKAEFAKFLLENGADVDSINRDGAETPLFIASSNDSNTTIQALVDYRADIEKPDDRGCTPLVVAASIGRENAVEALLKNGADANRSSKTMGTPLCCAVRDDRAANVRLLLEHGADSSKDASLIEALKRGNQNMIGMLLEKGACVNRVQDWTEEDGIPAWALSVPRLAIVVRELSGFVKDHQISFCPRQVEHPGEVEVTWRDTPLWVASVPGDEEIVKLL